MDFDILSDNILQSPSGKMYPVLSLSQGEETLYLPVTPSKVQIQSAQENKIVDILDFGENLLFGNPKLKRLKFSSFFPLQEHHYPFVVGSNISPTDAVSLITKFKESKLPVRVILTQSALNLNYKFAIEDFDTSDKNGSRDIYYTISLIESRDFNVPNANYTKSTDESGLKSRPSEITSSLLSSWRKNSNDIAEISIRTGSSIGDLLTKNNIGRIADFSSLTNWLF